MSTTLDPRMVNAPTSGQARRSVSGDASRVAAEAAARPCRSSGKDRPVYEQTPSRELAPTLRSVVVDLRPVHQRIPDPIIPSPGFSPTFLVMSSTLPCLMSCGVSYDCLRRGSGLASGSCGRLSICHLLFVLSRDVRSRASD